MNIEKLKLPNNWVCVSIDDSNEWINLPNGEKLKLDISYETEKHSQTVGKVVKICDNLFYHKKLIPSHPWKVPMELQEGDIAIFHFLSVSNSKKMGHVMDEDNKRYVFMPYSEIFCAIRDGKVVPVNGWILVEPEEKELPQTTFVIPEMAKGKSETRGTVLYAGAPVEDYKDYDYGHDPEVNVGDKITFKRLDAIPLQYEFHNLLGKTLYRMQRKDVLAILEEV